MKDTIAALEKAYREVATRESVCRPRVDIRIPTSDDKKVYQWGTMEGGSPVGLFRHPHEVRRHLRAGIQRRHHPGKILHPAGHVLRPDPAHLDGQRRAARLHQRRRAAAHEGRRRRRHRRQVHGARGRPCGRHAGLGRHGAHPHGGLHVRARHQEASGLLSRRPPTARHSARRCAGSTGSRWWCATTRATSTAAPISSRR